MRRGSVDLLRVSREVEAKSNSDNAVRRVAFVSRVIRRVSSYVLYIRVNMDAGCLLLRAVEKER